MTQEEFSVFCMALDELAFRHRDEFYVGEYKNLIVKHAYRLTLPRIRVISKAMEAVKDSTGSRVDSRTVVRNLSDKEIMCYRLIERYLKKVKENPYKMFFQCDRHTWRGYDNLYVQEDEEERTVSLYRGDMRVNENAKLIKRWSLCNVGSAFEDIVKNHSLVCEWYDGECGETSCDNCSKKEECALRDREWGLKRSASTKE